MLMQLCQTQVNLFLRVMRRREDGYHDLASLFHVRLLLSGQVGALELSYVSYMTSFDMQVIDLGDDMEFCRLEGTATADILECSDPTIPSDDSNLVIKVHNAVSAHSRNAHLAYAYPKKAVLTS